MKESVATLMAQYEDDYYVVFPDKELLNETALQVMDFKVSSSELLNLQKEKETVLNEYFNVFGISGSVEKRERMISGEMNAMMEQIAVNRPAALNDMPWIDCSKTENNQCGILSAKVSGKKIQQPERGKTYKQHR